MTAPNRSTSDETFKIDRNRLYPSFFLGPRLVGWTQKTKKTDLSFIFGLPIITATNQTSEQNNDIHFFGSFELKM